MLYTYKSIQTHILPVTKENWLTIWKASFTERDFYQVDQQTKTLHVGQVVAQFLGVPFIDDEYAHTLSLLMENEFLQLVTNATLEMKLSEQQIQLVEKLLTRCRENNIPINMLVSLLEEKELLVKSNMPVFQKKLINATTDLFIQLLHKENKLTDRQISNIYLQVNHAIQQHLLHLLNQIDFSKGMPKFLWYGQGDQIATYFLNYLIQLGCDVVIFNPSGKEVLGNDQPRHSLIFTYRYEQQKNLELLPLLNNKRQRATTVAYRASREIEAILHNEGSGLYKPWQLRDYIPSSITYQTTYDEIFILAKEKAFIRPYFLVHDGHVKIPVLFAKVQGVTKNRKEYWDRLHTILLLKNSLLIKQFPFQLHVNRDFRFHYHGALGNDGRLQPNLLIQSRYWPYRHLSMGLQNGIAKAINTICQHPLLKKMQHETNEDVKLFLFTQSMQIPPVILQLLQTFDFSQDVPKLILYQNGLSGQIARTDAALLLLLNQLGIDLIIYNPTGLRDIETYIDESVFDVHLLEEVVFEQEWKQPSLLKKLFAGRLFE